MNFIDAAHEIVNWTSTHPLAVMGIAAAVIVGGREVYLNHRKEKARAARVAAITAELPKVEPINLPKAQGHHL